MMGGAKKSAGKATARTARRRSCPICGKPAAEAHLPFCSDRCADLDLGFWLKGAYRIPAVEPPDSLQDDGAADDPAKGRDEGRE